MNQIFRLLGLGQKAGNVVSGDESVRAKLERRKAYLVIIAGDAAAETQKDFLALGRRYGVKCILYGIKAELGAAIGRSPRAVLAVLDKNLTSRILALWQAGT